MKSYPIFLVNESTMKKGEKFYDLAEFRDVKLIEDGLVKIKHHFYRVKKINASFTQKPKDNIFIQRKGESKFEGVSPEAGKKSPNAFEKIAEALNSRVRIKILAGCMGYSELSHKLQEKVNLSLAEFNKEIEILEDCKLLSSKIEENNVLIKSTVDMVDIATIKMVEMNRRARK